jgi:hypothetical protein
MMQKKWQSLEIKKRRNVGKKCRKSGTKINLKQ